MTQSIISSIVNDNEGVHLYTSNNDKVLTLSLDLVKELLSMTANATLIKSEENTTLSVDDSKININKESIQFSINDETYIRLESGKIELACSGNIIDLTSSNIQVNGSDVKVSASGSVNISGTQEVALKAMTVSAS
ncbi:hypothetical protein BGC07_06000 [Piscirickettsia litoralis]|uniref:DUF2345 domain-containing protein n=2 Tax=Piscirickettsia litoralis TaxID=1891921 RepID=A0ABX3A582_9GAMM|nr:hypothetical protein BGC07_06000 [Piscirickettsia litoralis]